MIKYPKNKTICYEIKSGGKVGEQIHFFFFARMSTGAITFPLKLTDAISLYSKNKSFGQMSRMKQEQLLMPFKVMDRVEMELKNLDIVDTSDKMNSSLRIVRRNSNIQKDFFSMNEYLIWGVNQHIENEYYKKKRRTNKKRILAIYD